MFFSPSDVTKDLYKAMDFLQNTSFSKIWFDKLHVNRISTKMREGEYFGNSLECSVGLTFLLAIKWRPIEHEGIFFESNLNPEISRKYYYSVLFLLIYYHYYYSIDAVINTKTNKVKTYKNICTCD